ncbi:MAG: hypothetical protein PHN51_01395 [Candidatus Nanopelagicales bacterium]|nr:hypothetical protein [Candidatus Nanopelagicales bacterium]
MSNKGDKLQPESVRLFVDTTRQMLNREEFLFPYIWAQRQYRDDNYQMASASLLEDLFFDTLGTYTKQQFPGASFSRRQGREPWDYEFSGVEFSHKEGQTPMFTAVWQAGSGERNKTPIYEFWDYSHPITFVYTPPSMTIDWELLSPNQLGNAEVFGKAKFLTPRSLAQRLPENSVIAYGKLSGDFFTVELIFELREFVDFSIQDVRERIGSSDLLSSDFLLITHISPNGRISDSLDSQNDPTTIHLKNNPFLPGIYVLAGDEIMNVPMESNNKAHFVPRAEVLSRMDSARKDGRFIHLPLWPSLYADMTPPNLYMIQRKQFDEIFQARKRI